MAKRRRRVRRRSAPRRMRTARRSPRRRVTRRPPRRAVRRAVRRIPAPFPEAEPVPQEVLQSLPKPRHDGWRPWAVAGMWVVLAFVAATRAGKVTGDGMSLYAPARAFVVHADFRLHDSDLVPTEPGSQYLQDFYIARAIEHGGRVWSGFGAGAPAIWLPAVAIAHAKVVVARAIGFRGVPPADGFSYPYRWAVMVTTLVLGLIGLVAAYRLAAALTGPDPAFLGVAAGLFATSLCNYLSYETAMSEGISFVLVTLVFLIWWRIRQTRDPALWGWWGLVIGVAGIVRYEHLVFVLLPVWEAWRGPARRESRLSAALGAIAAPLLFQLVVWRLSTGRWMPPPFPSGIESWTKFNPVMLLWSARHGLLASHPAWWIGILGFPLLLRRTGAWGWALLLYFAFLVWLNQLPFDYWAGESFGARRFVPATLLCVLGVARVADALIRRKGFLGHALAVAVVGLLVLLSAEALRDFRRLGPDRAFASPQGARVMPAAIYRWTGWPGSWPANLAWAVRHGVTPDRFDLGASLCADNPADFDRPGVDLRSLNVDFTHPRAVHLVAAGAFVREEDGLLFPDGVARIWINLCRPETIREIVLTTAGEGGFRPVEWGLVSPWHAPGTSVIEVFRPGRPLKLVRLTLRTTRD